MCDNSSMNSCFGKRYLVDRIANYLDLKDLTNYERSNKIINAHLNPDNNNYMNTLYLKKLLSDYFEYDKYNFLNKKNLLEKNLRLKTNWKRYLIELNITFSKCKNEMIKKKIRDFFRIHIYLPDLRKECFVLEFPNSTIHQIKSYDINTNLIHTYNYYSKYFTPELILNNNNDKGKIIILRERLLFEDYLLNFKELFYNFITNDNYIRFINNIREYNIRYLKDLYRNKNGDLMDFQKNEQLGDTIEFILWIFSAFVLYTKINQKYISDLLDNKNLEEKDLFYEYISKKNDLVNCALLINYSFENINIIVNLLGIYKNIYGEYKSKYLDNQNPTEVINQKFHLDKKDSDKYKTEIISSEKFTLYNLLLKIIDKHYIIKLTQIRDRFHIPVKNYFKEVFNTKQEKNIKETKMEIEEENSKNNNKKEKKLEEIINYKLTWKNLLEIFFNCELDNYINGKNAFGIMHSQFNIDEEYINKFENVLINSFEEAINNSISERIPLNKCFEIVEKITRCEGNSNAIYRNKDSLIIIRRTRLRFMQKGYMTIFKNLLTSLLKDFEEHIMIDESDGQKYIHLSTVEKSRMEEYQINLDVLSREGIKNVTNNVKSDLDKVKEYLKKNLNLSDSEDYLASDYINCSKIEYVYFLKELLWNYYKQVEIYEERNYKIEYYLKNCKNRFIEKKDGEKVIQTGKNKFVDKLTEKNLLDENILNT